MGIFVRILVPVDGSEGADQAMRVALTLAEDQGATVHFVHVIDDARIIMAAPAATLGGELLAALKSAGEFLLGQASERAHERGVVASSALQLTDASYPRIADRIVAEARAENADIIVCGSHGRTGFSAVLLGRVAESLPRLSQVPVLIVPAHMAPGAALR